MLTFSKSFDKFEGTWFLNEVKDMNRYIIAAVGCVLFLTAAVCPQKAKKRVASKIIPPVATEPSAVFPGYRFEITIGADKTSQLEIFTGYEFQDMDNGQLKKALTEYISMQTPAPRRKIVGPEVLIRPDEALDLQTIVDVAKTARLSASANVRIVTPDGQELGIPVDPKYEEKGNVKPNPLFLMVSLSDSGGVTLNNEDYGGLTDLSGLIAKLKEVFHVREINGVFREGSFDVEKTVHIKAYRSAKFAEIIQLAKVLKDAGAGPISLLVDELPENVVDTRRKLIIH